MTNIYYCLPGAKWCFCCFYYLTSSTLCVRELQLKLRARLMGEELGQIKVVVVLGKRLAIRDFKSSDPYVILKLGNQVLLLIF